MEEYSLDDLNEQTSHKLVMVSRAGILLAKDALTRTASVPTMEAGEKSMVNDSGPEARSTMCVIRFTKDKLYLHP